MTFEPEAIHRALDDGAGRLDEARAGRISNDGAPTGQAVVLQAQLIAADGDVGAAAGCLRDGVRGGRVQPSMRLVETWIDLAQQIGATALDQLIEALNDTDFLDRARGAVFTELSKRGAIPQAVQVAASDPDERRGTKRIARLAAEAAAASDGAALEQLELPGTEEFSQELVTALVQRMRAETTRELPAGAPQMLKEIWPIALERLDRLEQRDLHLRLMALWLDIPDDEFEEWSRRVKEGLAFRAEWGPRRVMDPAALADFASFLGPVSIEPLVAAAAAGDGVLVTTTHAGPMGAMFPALMALDTPVCGIGLWDLSTPDGQFRIERVGDRTTAEMRAAFDDYFEAGTIVVTTADSPGQGGTSRLDHHGVRFQLGHSAARMRWESERPLFWLTPCWVGDRIEVTASEIEGPTAGDAYEDYRDRVLGFVLDRARAVCLADPRNASFAQPALIGPAPTT